MNIRDLLADPFLPVMAQIKQDKKSFLKEWGMLMLCVGFSLFLVVFLVRMAWILPSVIL